MKLEKSAVISDCGQYRYSLYRRLAYGADRHLVWVMLNPSTANGEFDDPTIRKCKMFTMSHGFDSMTVINLFAYRATDPKELGRQADPIGPDNGLHWEQELKKADGIVVGWGSEKMAQPRGKIFTQVYKHKNLMCLGINANGSPRHPLFIPKATRFRSYEKELERAGYGQREVSGTEGTV